jgi:RNA polymerase sigma-70 factor (ECF subfamily)
VTGVIDGSESAFREVYVRHSAHVARVVFRVMGDDRDLDDVVQETFVDALEGVRALLDRRALRGWLVAVAVRKVRRLLGRRRRRALVAKLFGETAPQHTNARAAAEVREWADALDRIDPDVRIPWVLTRVCEMTLEEAAASCGCSLATVKRRIAVAEERLQRRLGDDHAR